MHRWASRLASSRSSAKAASIDVAESEGGGIPGLEARGWPIPRDRPAPSHRSGVRASRQRTARPTPRHAKGRAFPSRPKGRALPSRAKGRGAPESRLAGVGFWMRAQWQGSALVLEVAPLLRGP